MGAIKIHKTAVDTKSNWDGPKAVADAPNEKATLMYMHAWVDGKVDENKKSSYKFPHHEPGTDTPAVIAGVDNALARLPQANIPAGDVAGVKAHLRAHRKDAGLAESMSEAEIGEAVKFIKDVDDLKATESQALLEAVRLQEAPTLKSRAQALIRELKSLMGEKDLPQEVHDSADKLHAALQKTWSDLAAGAGGQEAAQIELAGDFIPLIEKAVRPDGIVPIKIIRPGWGSSGYYPAEVLKRDGPMIFVKDTKMYWNHQTPQEEAERPEGDLNNLAAVLAGDARWLDQGPKGPGLYADAKVFEGYQKPMDGLAPHIGVSIRAYGTASQGTMEGKTGPIISALTARKSIDFVTEPGAGGEIITMFEAARTVRADNQPATSQRGVENHEEVEMDEKELQKLQDTNATLLKENGEMKAENARLREALILREAKDLVGTVLAKSSLPDVTKTRLTENLAKGAPVKDGKLDKEAFATQIAEAVKAEVKYLTEATGLGKITGLGEGAEDEGEEEEQNDKLQESLKASFETIGLSETAAEKAAKGRG